MNKNSYLDSVKILSGKPYPLPHVHSSSSQDASRSIRLNRGLGLGINEQSGRLQWCPGVTCCKLLIIIPVILLPVTLALILLMRMDNMLTALRLQKEQQQLQQHKYPAYLDDISFNLLPNKDDFIEDIVNEQFILPSDIEKRQLNEEKRIKRCITFKFGLSETTEVEDRDIMKDARTSFLPQGTTAIPRECLDKLSSIKTDGSFVSDAVEEMLRRRLRRTSGDNTDADQSRIILVKNVGRNINSDSGSHETSSDENPLSEEEVRLFGATSALQTFWNEEGTKESIRDAQAKTMRKYMDTRVNPCTDFYKYACGNWERLHPIPKDKAGFDTFEMLRENLDVVLRELLESKKDAGTAASHKKVIDIQHNNYEHRIETNADIIKSGSPVPGTVAVVNEKTDISKSDQDELKEKVVRLRRHIVQHRDTLGLILRRYKRQKVAINKRKRLMSLFGGGHFSPEDVSTTEYFDTNDAQLKAKYLYQSCINTNLLQRRGIKPLLKLIENLGGWPVLNPNWKSQDFDWLNLTAQLRRYNNDILIVEWVGPDIKNSDENIIQFDQTSLGLPTREYFLQDMNARYLTAYQLFMSDIMQKLGAPRDRAIKTAAEVVAFETRLASITAPAEQRLNVTKLYNRLTLKQLNQAVPEINWLRYLSTLQDRTVRDSEEVVIYALDYMNDLVRLIRTTDTSTVSNYLLWRFVRHRINNVDDRFEDTKQNFYHSLFGREESPLRWKVCIAQVNTNMGMALGSMFVRKYFDENSKRDTLKMTHELQQAFREILSNTDWLDTNTKHLAELKVNAMSLKIGYPDFILNPTELNEKYTGIRIHPDRYFENTLAVLLHTARMEQNKLQESVNKTAWQTAPAIVNAYYSRNKNQIMFPAGILQPPFYHRHFPRSLNFGGIGVVIGHELTHGFDDKGRLFDRNGSIHKWWTDASIKGFDERARCIIAQYSNYTVGEVGISLNGESTQGENIADNGGLRQAFHAYKAWLKNNPQAAADERLPGIDMTGEQLFFLNFGQVWCGAMRPEAVRNKLNTAIHSPGRFRVIGTLSNSKDFAREFKCPEGSPMNPVHKCSVW